MPTKYEEIDAALSAVQTSLDGLKCSRQKRSKDGGLEPCLRQFDEKRDSKGRQVFWFGVDCEVPRKHFCDSCLAYWLVAVARNVVLSEARWVARTGVAV